MSDQATTNAPVEKEDLVKVINEAFARTGPDNLKAALVKVAERLQALEALLA